MGAWSKLSPNFEGLSCKDLIHPWTDSCLLASAYTWADSFIGSAGFFTVLYLCQFASMVLKKKRKINLKDFLRMIIRSTVFGATVTMTTFACHCFLRRLLGKYYYYTMVFIPAFIGGHVIRIESQKGREFFVKTFANCALEFWIRLLEQSKILKWNSNTQTIVFMALSSLLSSLLSRTNFNLNYFWFFLPPEVNKNQENEVCFHKEKCTKHIFSLFVMYSTTGLVLQFLRLFMNNFKNPKILLSNLKSPKTFKLAAFLGGYVVIYQTIRCFLYQKEKKYSSIHDSLAGFLAGVAFRFQPTIPIFNSAIITLVQIFAEVGYQRKVLPNIPYLEILFACLCALLFHARIILSEHCPQLMIYMMSAVTHGLSDRVTHSYKSFLNNLTNDFRGRFKNK